MKRKIHLFGQEEKYAMDTALAKTALYQHDFLEMARNEAQKAPCPTTTNLALALAHLLNLGLILTLT